MANTYLPNTQASAGINGILAFNGGTAPVASASFYLGLNTTSPGQTGANEVTGGSYARQALTFGAAASGVATSSDAQNFTSMPSTTIDYFSIWSAATSGTYGLGGQLTSSLTVPAGATVAFATGAVTVEVQG